MPIKTLQWWEKEFLAACGLACLYQCQLSLDQFCASRGIEPEDKEYIQAHFAKHHICR